MTPKRFTVIDKDPPFFIGDSLWRIDETTARAAVPSDDCNSENFLTVVYNTDRPDPICANRKTCWNIELTENLIALSSPIIQSLISWLCVHEDDIQAGINDFGELNDIFERLVGRAPGEAPFNTKDRVFKAVWKVTRNDN